MHTLFNLDLNIQAGQIRHPDWNYIRENLRKNLSNFISYYRDTNTSVKSDHILVKLLQSIPVSQSLEINKFYDAVDTASSNLSMALKFTSPLSKGNIFHGVFYGHNSDEVLVTINEPFDISYHNKQWKDIRAVQVIKHDRTNLALNPLTGNDPYPNEISVITINIPLLALQYRAFRANEALVNAGDSQRSIMQFVAKYVLPNMMYSHLDLVIFNRVKKLLDNKECDPFNNKTPFYQTDFSSKIDKVLSDNLSRFVSTKARFDQILRSIQTVTADNLLDTLLLPKIAPTKQVLWALVLSRVDVLEFLFDLNTLAETSENQANMNKIIRQAIFYKSDNTLQYGLTPEIYLSIRNKIDKLVSQSKIQ